MTATTPQADGPSHSEREVLDAIAAAARLTHPADPVALTQAQFDNARDQVDPPGLPRAKSLARRFAMPWRRLVEISLEPPERHTLLLGRLISQRDSPAPSLGQVLVALRQAAIRLGADTISQTTYDHARHLILNATARAMAQGADRDLMPTLTQIEGLLATNNLTWAQACTQAGLRPPDANASRVQAMDADQAVAWFAQTIGLVPASFNQLDIATANAGVARKRMRAADVTAAIQRLQAARAAAGLDPLPAQPGKGALEHITTVTPGQPTARTPKRRPKMWKGPAIIEGLATAIGELRPGERLTQRRLGRIAIANPDVPGYSVVHRHATQAGTNFEALIRQAEQLRRDKADR